MMDIPEGELLGVLCDDCGKEPAVVIFSDSVLEVCHGVAPMICRKCYIERCIGAHMTVSANLYKMLREEAARYLPRTLERAWDNPEDERWNEVKEVRPMAKKMTKKEGKEEKKKGYYTAKETKAECKKE